MTRAALRFLGATATVTGSKFLVTAGGTQVLVDAGLFQGPKALRRRNRLPLGIDPAALDGVVLSHAHLDHVGYLPVLVRHGLRCPVLATEATARLAAIVLADSGRLQEEEAEFANRHGYSKHHPALPLYTEADAKAAAARITPVALGGATEAGGVRLSLTSAGHILGSATVRVEIDEGRAAVFSGDLGRAAHPLLAAPAPPPPCDVLVLESTYGDRTHEDEEAALERLAGIIRRTDARGGVVVIPAFAVDRTEVILHHLRRLGEQGRIPEIPVYVDSPMGVAVLDVYRAAIAAHDPELRMGVTVDDFSPPGGVREVRSVAESIRLNEIERGIIVSSSGMATGGRVLHHLARRLPDERNSVLLVGYQSVGTRGARLLSGATAVKMLGSYVPVRAEIGDIQGFSVHADAGELVEWVARCSPPPRLVYLVHGEPEASASLARRLVTETGVAAVVPSPGEVVSIA